MHDLFESQRILKVVLEKAKEAGAKKINSVKIGMGTISDHEHDHELLPENIAFNLEKLAGGTIAEKAKFDVYKMKGESWQIDEMDVD
jgi:Zn finger protein HypA/HybF involved in hydrogenase expression